LNLHYKKKSIIRTIVKGKTGFALWLAAFLCLICPRHGYCQSVDHPLYYEELYKAVELLLAMRMDEGEELIQGWIERNREKPAGYFFHAAAISGRIYLLPKDKDVTDLKKKLEKAISSCRRTAKKLLSRDENKFEGTLYLGANYGLEALLAMLDRKYLAIPPLAKRAWNHLNQAETLDPEYYDTYFGLGSYLYIIDTLPVIIKILALGYGFEVDRQRGLAHLRLASKGGLYTQDASLIMLMNLYSEYETPDSSISIMANKLYKRYPDNPLVHWRYGDILFRLEEYEAANKIYLEVMERISSNYTFYRNRMFSDYLITYRLGMCDKHLGRKEQAIQHFNPILTDSEITPEWVVSASYLACGEIYLEQGNDELARSNLKEVLKHGDSRGSHRKAKDLLKKLKK